MDKKNALLAIKSIYNKAFNKRLEDRDKEISKIKYKEQKEQRENRKGGEKNKKRKAVGQYRRFSVSLMWTPGVSEKQRSHEFIRENI